MIKETIHKKIKRYYKRIVFNEFHESHQDQALHILSEVENQRGKLSPAIKKYVMSILWMFLNGRVMHLSYMYTV
ncbi:hypothetical protein B5C26_08235 [Photorhabdus luminescens]|nr:hypothetical protein B5C26_08235 [Photorhabdus luminescens]